MEGRGLGGMFDLHDLYRRSEKDPPFIEVLTHLGADRSNDAVVAELIEQDARMRMRCSREVTLDRYLESLEEASRYPDSLDAAVDMALRQLSMEGHNQDHGVAMLQASHPELTRQIEEAAQLGNAICSTTQVRTRLVSPLQDRSLPGDFGPLLESGEHRYELQRILGEGAFGQVYLAIDRQLSEADHDALVAIKVLYTGDGDQWGRQRLIDEATKARRIEHGNVVRVLDRGVSDRDEDYIVYEYVDGGHLGKWARRERESLGAEMAARLVHAMAQGLHAAHMSGLIHADLKPANVLMTSDGEPKLADFGIAVRSTGESGSDLLPPSDQPLGSLAFISPEQYRMEPGALNAASDLYALGGILYWLLSGQLPNGSSAAEVSRTHDPDRGRREAPKLDDVDQDLMQICCRAMSPKASDRYASASAMADDLSSWLNREPIGWTKPSPYRRLRLWATRRPALAAAVGVISLLLLGGLVGLQQLLMFNARVDVARIEEGANAHYARKHVGKIRAAMASGIHYDLLPQAWWLEWHSGPFVLDVTDQIPQSWERRIAIIEQLLQEASGRGEEGTLAYMLWQLNLCVWYINEGRFDEADRLLQDCHRSFADRLDPDDPLLHELEALMACVIVGRACADRVLDELFEGPAIRQIERAEAELRRRVPGNPIHTMMLRMLLRAYRPEAINAPEQYAHYDAVLAVVLE